MTPYALILILCSTAAPVCKADASRYMGLTYDSQAACQDAIISRRREIRSRGLQVLGHRIVLRCDPVKVTIKTHIGERRA